MTSTHKRVLLISSFSINMLPAGTISRVEFRPISLDEAQEIAAGIADGDAHIGHADTAAIVGAQLGRPLTANRDTIVFDGDVIALLVAQYTGPRLGKGATELPPGAVIEYWLVTRP